MVIRSAAHDLLCALRLRTDPGSWVLPDQVLACAYPRTESALAALGAARISIVVNLHERPHGAGVLPNSGLQCIAGPAADELGRCSPVSWPLGVSGQPRQSRRCSGGGRARSRHARRRTFKHSPKNSPFPLVTVIALDDFSGMFSYDYADGRGVRRVYRMTLSDGEWKYWGQAAADFFQRFTGTFSQDGATIRGLRKISGWVKLGR